jgi:uncharacterized membrane protein YcaP (DUF421 family)
MDAVIRAAVVYVFLLVVLRLSGKRTLAQVTTFDFVLLLIISEATQQALVDSDNSMINAGILVTTLVGMNILMSLLKQRWKFIERLLEGVPLVVVADGKPRESQGLERIEQIKHAVVERSGQISVIPRESRR